MSKFDYSADAIFRPRRRRRCRWTVTLAGTGERRVALAYTAEGARDCFERMGHEVLAVHKGDSRRPSRSPSGARPVADAVREAQALLGLKHPVKIRLSSRQGGCSGLHSAIPTGGSVFRSGRSLMLVDTATGWQHEIMVKSYLDAETMGRTLWHELAHALQFERDALSLGLRPSATLAYFRESYSDGTSYSRKPAEVEARQHENLNDDLPLAR